MKTSTAAEIPAEAYHLGALRRDFDVSWFELAMCVALVIFLVVFIGWGAFSGFPGALAPENAPGNGAVYNRFALIEVAGEFRKRAVEMTILA